MTEFEGDRQEAEADLRRASDAVNVAESELAIAEEKVETIEQEIPDGPDDEADISRRMEAAEAEVERHRQVVAEAHEELSRTVSLWEQAGYLPS